MSCLLGSRFWIQIPAWTLFHSVEKKTQILIFISVFTRYLCMYLHEWHEINLFFSIIECVLRTFQILSKFCTACICNGKETKHYFCNLNRNLDLLNYRKQSMTVEFRAIKCYFLYCPKLIKSLIFVKKITFE